MAVPDFTELLLAVQGIESGVKRVEEKIDALEKKTDSQFDRFEKTLLDHQEQLTRHEVDIRLIEQRIGPKVHVIAWVAAIAAGISIVLGILDRIYAV